MFWSKGILYWYLIYTKKWRKKRGQKTSGTGLGTLAWWLPPTCRSWAIGEGGQTRPPSAAGSPPAALRTAAQNLPPLAAWARHRERSPALCLRRQYAACTMKSVQDFRRKSGLFVFFCVFWWPFARHLLLRFVIWPHLLLWFVIWRHLLLRSWYYDIYCLTRDRLTTHMGQTIIYCSRWYRSKPLDGQVTI